MGAEDINSISAALRLKFVDDFGGADADRGFFYQHLYVLRLMRRILEGEIDAYVCECGGDFVTWKGAVGFDRLIMTLTEVKSCSQASFSKQATKGITMLATRAVKIAELFPEAELRCRLVYNAGKQASAQNEVRLHKLKSKIDWPAFAYFEVERFVSLDLTIEEMRKELDFLSRYEPGAAALFAAASNARAFLETLLGFTVPFHARRCVPSLVTWANVEGLHLGKLRQDTSEAVATVRDALSGALHYANSPERRARVSTFVEASQRAERALTLARPSSPATITDAPKWWLFGSGHAALRCAMTTELIDRNDPAIAPLGRVQKNAKQFAVKVDLTGLLPLRRFLALKTTTHRRRAALLRSFGQAIARWATKGLMMTSEFVARQDRWFVRDVDSEEPRFVTTSLRGLEPFDPSRGLLDPRWVRALPLASALRTLYYGTATLARLRRTAIYNANWNDNAVDNLADLLELDGFIWAGKVGAMLAELFGSERYHWPIFVSDIDPQFLRDSLKAGHRSPLEALCEARPKAWQIDRGRDHPLIFYVRCGFDQGDAQVQIGLLATGDGTWRAYRYFRYGAERGISHLTRDESSAAEIRAPRSPAFILLREASEFQNVVWQVFGVRPATYVEWLRNQRLPDRRGVSEQSPWLLEREEALHEIRLTRRNALRQKSFPCCAVVASGDAVNVVCGNGAELKAHLEYCGYRLESCGDLFLNAHDAEEAELWGYILEAVERVDGSICLRVSLAEVSARELPNGGSFFMHDRGLDSVVQSEQGLFGELFSSFEEGAGDEMSPARIAWEFVEEMVANIRSGPSKPDSLWDGECKPVQKSDEASDEDPVTQVLDALSEQSAWQIVTGAPGTGKTRTMAALAARYLDRHANRTFPPCRVLIVANTHWAVDNFVRAFTRDKSRRDAVFRAVSPGRRLRLINQGVLTREFLEQLERQFEKTVLAQLPSISSGATFSNNVTKHRVRLEQLRDQLRIAERLAKEHSHGCLIPSHVHWRAARGEVPARFEKELRLSANLVQEKLDALGDYHPPSLPPGTTQGELMDLRIFASELVAVTVDGIMRLPDMGFDLVIFEEASQVSLVGILKVLTKVVRARGPDSNLHVVLSGDPQQLPPFLGTAPNCVTSRLKRVHEEVESSPSLFAAICKDHSHRLCTLTTQRRMHPEIATLVNSLFYSKQSWRRRWSSEFAGAAVWWIDSGSRGEVEEPEPGSTSWLHSAEIAIVKQIASDPGLRHGRLLAITPYAAQQQRLELVLPGRGLFRTIDGCQGVEAETVIISFVRMSSSFVVDYRRLNVALSRARKRLYLVGDFAALRKAADSRDAPHLRGLVALFSADQIFASRLLTADPHFQVPI